MLAAACWGLIGPVVRVAFDQGISPLELAFWRALLGGLLFGLHAGFIGRTRVERPDLGLILGFGVVGVALFFGAYQFAVKTGGAALASVLLYTAPAWVALLSRIFLGELITGGKFAALLLTLLGVAGVSLQGGEVHPAPLAIAWGLLSGFTYALYYLFGKLFLSKYSTPTLFLYSMPVGALALFPLVQFDHKTTTSWLAIGFMVLVSTYGAYLAYYAGLSRLEATRASVVASLEPVVAAVTAYFFWGERFGPLGILGSVLVLFAVVVMVLLPGPKRALLARVPS